jgi:hypothetical protein
MIAALQRNHFVAWLGTLALLCNGLVGSFGYGSTRPVPLTDEVLGALIICTAHGLEGGDLDSGGKPINKRAEHCPACVTISKTALLDGRGFVDIAIKLSAVIDPVPERAPSTARLNLGGIGSRAPPMSA